MVKKKNAVRCLALALLSAAFQTAAYAQQSPEFAYSEEKWAALRDDVLEFDEIADLIHEYNNTVIQNAISYRDERDKTSDDVAQDYYDAADEIYSNMDYPDSEDSNYGSGVAAYLNNEIQAEKLREQGDKNTDNSETIKLGYDRTEASLVKQAEEQMIDYWSQLYSLESLREEKEQSEADLAAEEMRLAAGTSTQSKVLAAKQSVSSADASLISAQSTLAKTKESLCLMLGWAYGAEVTIGELPEPDIEALRSIDLAADIETAKENNYSLKASTLQYGNARTVTVRDTLAQTVKNAEQAISNNVSSSYQSLLLAASNYEQAVQAYEIAEDALETAQRKLEAGTISQTAYDSVKTAYIEAEVSVRRNKLSLLTAQVTYGWNVNGLAEIS